MYKLTLNPSEFEWAVYDNKSFKCSLNQKATKSYLSQEGIKTDDNRIAIETSSDINFKTGEIIQFRQKKWSINAVNLGEVSNIYALGLIKDVDKTTILQLIGVNQ